MPRWTLAMVAAVLGAVLVLPAHAQTQWKWRDKSGRTQYSDLPPPASVPEQDILARPAAARARAAAAASGVPATAATSPMTALPGVAPAAGASAPFGPLAAASSPLAPKTTDPELEAKRKKAEAEQDAKKKAEETKAATVRAENCERAKAQVRTLDSGIRVGRVNAQGEREILDDKQRAEETQRARGIIAADCK